LTPTFDWAAAESWLSQKAAKGISDAAWKADPRWLRAQELWLVGRTSQGDSEALSLMESKATDPVAMYTMSRQLQAAGRVSMAGRAGQRLVGALNTTPSEGLPKPLLSLAYPAAFATPTARYAT